MEETFSKHIHLFPKYHAIQNILADSPGLESPNVLLYGVDGFPQEWLWYSAIKHRFGNFQRKECIWSKIWVYWETPYFLEIDMMHPNQPKDSASLADFLKEIIVHASIHADRHIIFLRNIDLLCARGESYMLRVLFERFSKNVWFVCTTYHIGNIESPLRSRFVNLTVPLMQDNDIRTLFDLTGARVYEESFSGPHHRNLHHHMFLAEHGDRLSDDQRKHICAFRAPPLGEWLINGKRTWESVREVTQKICVYNFSFVDLVYDLIAHSPQYSHEIISLVQYIEHMCAQTDRYRKPLYVEYLLHAYMDKVK